MSDLGDPAALRTVYREPHQLVVDKGIDHVDEGAASFLAATTLIVVASRGPAGGDASPRGGPPGFVRVLDDGRSVAFADLAGNNRLDTYTNVVADPAVGVLAIVPGLEETLRIRGTARITVDPELRAAVSIDDRVPKAAIVIDVTECFIHCGKALRRSGAWDPASWPAKEAGPSPAGIIAGHAGIDAPAAAIEADLEAGYQATLWEF